MNSAEFKHFKLHADSTLKGMTKDELISYIHMLHHNWEVCDDMLVSFRDANLVKYQYINTLERDKSALEKALDKTCERLSVYSIITLCYRTAEEYREWAMEDETD